MSVVPVWHDPNSGKTGYTALSTDTLPNAVPGSQAYITDQPGTIKENIGGAWVQTRSGGATKVYGLARNAVRVPPGTYNATEIYGFRILVAGTGTLTLSPVGGATDIVITAAEITAMGVNAFVDWPLHCDSITPGSGMEVLVYTP